MRLVRNHARARARVTEGHTEGIARDNGFYAVELVLPERDISEEPDAVRPATLFGLVITDGAQRGAAWVCERDRCTVGADPACDVVLAARGVSPVHCEIAVEGEAARLRHRGGAIATEVDGVPVLDCWLRDGALVRVGPVALRFSWAVDEDAGAGEASELHGLRGTSVPMRAIFVQIRRVATSNVTVLLEGETGTGKQVAAEALHGESARAGEPFITIDCGSLPEGLLESELFGHEKGAFTGADDRRIGAFEEAAGGTVFLDEIGELPVGLQPALLRALEQREIRRVGANRYIPVDVRVIAATNRDLRTEVSAGRFRSDLYFRLAVVQIRMPSLRSRPDDIPALVAHFAEQAGAPPAMRAKLASREALAALRQAPWPGNVRELKNYIQRCVVFRDVLPIPVGQATTAAEPSIDLRVPWTRARADAIATFERSYLRALMARHKGRVATAAEHAEIDRVYLYKLLRRHGIEPGE